jgi:biopolymer transport protein ExbB/TolQ
MITLNDIAAITTIGGVLVGGISIVLYSKFKSDQNTKEIENIKNKQEQAGKELHSYVHEKITEVNSNLQKIQNRCDITSERRQEMDMKIYDKMEKAIDKLEKKIDSIDIKMSERINSINKNVDEKITAISLLAAKMGSLLEIMEYNKKL